MSDYTLHLGDCLEVMKTLPDASIDCVLTDPPYGTTACKWDSVIPFEPMWKELKRIAKPRAAICLFGSQPFTSTLICSNPSGFRYEWIWEKTRPSNFFNANKQPMKYHENIAVFFVNQPTYNPQKWEGFANHASKPRVTNSNIHGLTGIKNGVDTSTSHFPRSIIKVKSTDSTRNVHPTQKPVELLRYLIRTYTLANETVLDFTMGSGTTGVACQLENRNFIGIEKDAGYFEIAKKRIEGVKQQEPLFAQAA